MGIFDFRIWGSGFSTGVVNRFSRHFGVARSRVKGLGVIRSKSRVLGFRV